MMSSRTRVRALLVSAAVLAPAAAAGCGGDDDASSSVEPSPGSVDVPAGEDDGAVDTGCPLSTEQVVSVIQGELSDMGCGWTGERADVFLSTYPGGLWSEYRGQHEPAAVASVAGLGDDAYLVESGSLHVLVGDSAYDVMVHATDPTLDADAAKRALAELIVAEVAS